MTTCKGCGAPVLWAKVTNSDRNMPLDPEPSPDRGNVRLVDGFATVLGPLEVHAARASDEPLRLSHHATCPKAAQFRRPR